MEKKKLEDMTPEEIEEDRWWNNYMRNSMMTTQDQDSQIGIGLVFVVLIVIIAGAVILFAH